MPKTQWPPEMGREAALAAAQRVAGEDEAQKARVALHEAFSICHGALLCIASSDPNWSIYASAVADKAASYLIGDALACSPGKGTSPFYKTLNEEAAEGENCDLDYRPDTHPTPNGSGTQMSEHQLKDGTLKATRDGSYAVEARCTCGWVSAHFTSLSASAAFQEHQEQCRQERKCKT